MKILNRNLTLNPVTGNGTYECIAGCRVDLDQFDRLGMAVNHTTYTLSCYLEGVDYNNPNDDVYTFTPPRTFSNPLELDMDHVFRAEVSTVRLNEDLNSGDEIRAVFTLVNNDTSGHVIKKSSTHVIEI
jgi:hypothetical protein